MKFAYFALLSLVCCACSPQIRQAMKPNHFGITPSCEWELKEGCKPLHKPKISSSLDWEF